MHHWENKTSCVRESRAAEEIQREDDMTKCSDLGAGKASNVIINVNGVEKNVWMCDSCSSTT